MNEILLKVIPIAVAIGSVWIFTSFKPVREFLYLISGVTALFFVFKFAFNGEIWFLDLSKLELVGFILIACLTASNYKHSKVHSLPLHQSLKTDFVYFGLPAFYISIALAVLARKISKQNYGIESGGFVISETTKSTTLLLAVIIPLVIRNISLRFSAVTDEVASGDSTIEVKSSSTQQDQREKETQNIEVAPVKAE